MTTTMAKTEAACAECCGPLIPGLNTDFCSLDCEETWTLAHTWPCLCSGETRDESGFCRRCGETGEYVDFARRRCDWDRCAAEAQAGQDFCGHHLVLIHGVTEGTRHTP